MVGQRHESSGGLREKHKHRTRIALRDAAIDLFLRRGFDATTVEEVAAAVDVSPRTFFRYFPTKSDVVVIPYIDLFDRWESLVNAGAPGRPLIEVLRDASHLVTDAYEHDSQFWDRHHKAVTTDPSLSSAMLQTQSQLQQRATTTLARRLGLDPHRDLRPRILAAAAMAATSSAVAQWYLSGQRANRRRLVDEAYGEIEAAAHLLGEALPIPSTPETHAP
jgi:AcrR family transcriptional regulator